MEFTLALEFTFSSQQYVFSNTYDSDKFVVPHVVFVQLKQQLRQYTIGVDYSILDNV